MPPAESGERGRAEGVPDGQSGAAAQPPRPHAAGPPEAHLRQRGREAGQWPRISLATPGLAPDFEG